MILKFAPELAMAVAACVALLLTTLLLWSPDPVLSTGQAFLLLLVAGAVAGRCRGARGLVLVLAAGLPVVGAVDVSTRVLGDRWPDEPALGDADVSGSVCEFPREQPGSWRFVLTTDAESQARGIPARVLVSWYDGSTRSSAAPAPGQRWSLRLRLRSPRGLSNPGGFDYERWLFSQQVGATAWVRESAGNHRLPGSTSGCPAAGWRAAMARQISAALDGRDAAPWVLGLAIGAYQALPESDWDKLRRTGTIHLISISGFHIALVAGPAALLGLLVARIWLAAGRRCRPRIIAAWTAVFVASFYAALAGFSVPTLRSVVAIVLVALLATCRRAVTVPEMLAAVLLAVLLIEPLGVLVPGFWLSFAGVAVLIIVACGLPVNRVRPGPVQLLLRTQLGMTVGLAPLLILFFGQLPLSGTLANLVAVPAFSAVLLPLTLLGSAAVAVAPAAGALLLGAAADCFDLWRDFLSWCSNLPLAVWYLPEPTPMAVVLALAGAVSALWPPPWPGRWLGLAMLPGLLYAGAGAVPAGALRVTVLDVGQGLAVLVQTTAHTLLYDTGPAFRNSDAGQRVVVPALQALGVQHLDALMISHPDADHRGGAASVLARYPASRIVGAAVDGHPVTPCRAGTHWGWDGFEFEILHPPQAAVTTADNDGSCVLQISGAGSRVLLPGDIEAQAEHDLVARPASAAADLVLAPHHGSRTSSTAAFVQATRPRYVVYSTGFRNRWNFPASDVVERWRQSGACGVSTAEEGALQFDVTPDAGLQLVRRQRAAALGVWLARPTDFRSCR
ncbi:MAG: ComEC/Rec2 family competence protein [Gammaproteobacteria bacterium]|nr:ComEC/Rec2 family competence protein [Gammaproteobacteria bacterium]